MNTTNLRNVILDHVKEVDDFLLNEQEAVVEKHDPQSIVAYSVDGKPLTKKQYSQELEEAEREMAAEDFIT